MTKSTEMIDKLEALVIDLIELLHDNIKNDGVYSEGLGLIESLPETVKTIEEARDLIERRERRKEPVDYTECLAKCEE